MSNYKLQSRFPLSYKELENALDIYDHEHELYFGKYNEIAKHVIDFCNKTFDYIPKHQERIEHFLQGLGLNIKYFNDDIYELMYKEGRLLKTDSDNRHIKFLNNYWKFMAMRLICISNSKDK